MASADESGHVHDSIPSIANNCMLSVEEVVHCLTVFESPDEFSRTPDNDGRRIEHSDEGIFLINFAKHQACIQNTDQLGQLNLFNGLSKETKREEIKKVPKKQRREKILSSKDYLSSNIDTIEAGDTTSTATDTIQGTVWNSDVEREIFEYWKKQMKKPGARLTGGRKQKSNGGGFAF